MAVALRHCCPGRTMLDYPLFTAHGHGSLSSAHLRPHSLHFLSAPTPA